MVGQKRPALAGLAADIGFAGIGSAEPNWGRLFQPGMFLVQRAHRELIATTK